MIWLALIGCTTLSTLEGARTLEPGQLQVVGGLSLQRGGNPLSYAGIPIPQLEVAGRYGVAPDLDLGFRLYMLGLGTDVRYRFIHEGDLHVAVTPGLYGFWLPGAGSGQGSIEVRTPLTAEYELTEVVSVAGGPRLVLRNQWNSIDDPEIGRGSATRLDVFAGAGGRLELHPKRLVVGFGLDLYGQPTRYGGLSWSAGVDFGFRSRSRADRGQ